EKPRPHRVRCRAHRDPALAGNQDGGRPAMSQPRRLTGPKKYLAVFLAVLFILLIWQVAAWSLPSFLMPDIPTVVERLSAAVQEPAFLDGLSGSMSRLGTAYSSALLFGIGFGLVGGVLFFFREILR